MTHPEDTAIIERDLRAVDAALGGDGASHEDHGVRELQQLALALRADAPVPDRGFAEELKGRVEAGFPAKDGARERQDAALARLARRGSRRRRLNLLPVAGVVAPLLLIVVVIALGGGEPGEEGSGDGGGGGGAIQRDSAPEAGAMEAAPPAQAPGFAPAQRQRRIERSIAMTLTAPDDEIPALAEGVSRVTARNGGFVLSSQLDTSDDGATGSYELRIPGGRLQAALRALAGLGTVSSQSQSGQDVTREFVTAADRLQAARAERRSLLRRLERAETDEDAEAIRMRLDLVAGEINGLRGQLRDLRLRTDYAIVSVDLIGEDGDSGAGGAGGAVNEALGDAESLLVGAAGVLIRALAIALPLALIGGFGWLASGALRRRRRESALA